jgi:3-amino-5-hydroxybenzoate synthase
MVSLSTSPKLALLGGPPVLDPPPAPWPVPDAKQRAALLDAFDSGAWWSMTARHLPTFERRFAAMHEMPWGVAVTNGTHAIEVALRALGIGPGDEVVVPAITFAATAMAVFAVGARAITVDVDSRSWCLDAAAAARAFTTRTRAVVPVHLLGHVADMDALSAACAGRHIAIIEDAAQAHGARRKGRSAGSFGAASTFSFQASKVLTSGEGGIVLFRDAKHHDLARLIINCGHRADDTDFEHTILGSNYRMTELQAAILNAQLDGFQLQAARRGTAAASLRNGLRGIDGIVLQEVDPEVEHHTHWGLGISIDRRAFGGISRNSFVAALTAEGFPALRMYPRIQDTPFFAAALRQAGGRSDDLPPSPVAQNIADCGVWLHHRLLLCTPADAALLVTAIEKIRANCHLLREHKQAHAAA